MSNRAALEGLRRFAAERGLVAARDWKHVRRAEVAAAVPDLPRTMPLIDVLREAFPDMQWREYECRPQVSRGYWDEAAHRREFLERTGAALGIPGTRTWKDVSGKELAAHGGRGLLLRYRNSVAALVADTLGFQEASTKGVRRWHWEEASRRREFVQDLAKRHGMAEAGDWAALTAADVVRQGGGSLLARYASVQEMLRDCLPEHSIPVPARKKPGHWEEEANQRAFLEEFAAQRRLQWPHGWRAVTYEDIRVGGGKAVLQRHSSVFGMLQALFPEHEWVEAECRPQVRQEFWDSASNCKRFLQRMEGRFAAGAGGWAAVRRRDVEEAGGAGLLGKYGSLYGALAAVFPERRWDAAELQSRMPDGYWTAETARLVLDRVAANAGICLPTEWFKLSKRQLVQAGCYRLLLDMPLQQGLALAYPSVDWTALERESARVRRRAAQHRLFCSLRTIVEGSDLPKLLSAQ